MVLELPQLGQKIYDVSEIAFEIERLLVAPSDQVNIVHWQMIDGRLLGDVAAAIWNWCCDCNNSVHPGGAQASENFFSFPIELITP